jgi:hypothetical protein
MCVCAEWDTERTSKTEVSNLQVALIVDEQILRLQVSVQDAMRVTVLDAGYKLQHELLDNCLA